MHFFFTLPNPSVQGADLRKITKKIKFWEVLAFVYFPIKHGLYRKHAPDMCIRCGGFFSTEPLPSNDRDLSQVMGYTDRRTDTDSKVIS
jgi:hypothetical protein